MLAFWNSGNPRIIRNASRVVMPNGDVRFNAGPDPDDDLYAFVEGQRPGRFQRISATAYSNDGWTITETHTIVDEVVDRAKDQLRREATGKFRAVADGGVEVDLGGGPIVLATVHAAVQELAEVADLLGPGETEEVVTRAGNVVVLDAAAATAAKATIIAHRRAARARETALHKAIKNAGTVADLHLIDASTGWPAIPSEPV